MIKCYNSGINNISYDFLIKKDEESYHWIRINARIFFWTSDESVRMISYRKNIDEEKIENYYFSNVHNVILLQGFTIKLQQRNLFVHF